MTRALALAAVVGAVAGGGATAAVVLLMPEGETAARTGPESGGTQKEEPGAAFTPFDDALLRYVPDDIRPSCRHAPPVTDKFDATVSCRPGGVVDSLTYSHARSGRYLYDYLADRMAKAGLPVALTRPRAGLCRTGDVPSVNGTVAVGLSGRAEEPEPVTREQRLGLVLCAETPGGARIEWLTQEVAIYAIARGTDLAALYEWWRSDAGPEA